MTRQLRSVSETSSNQFTGDHLHFHVADTLDFETFSADTSISTFVTPKSLLPDLTALDLVEELNGNFVQGSCRLNLPPSPCEPEDTRTSKNDFVWKRGQVATRCRTAPCMGWCHREQLDRALRRIRQRAKGMNRTTSGSLAATGNGDTNAITSNSNSCTIEMHRKSTTDVRKSRRSEKRRGTTPSRSA